MEPLCWCRERLLVRGNPLTASLQFAPSGLQDQILALRAVITEIASISGHVSEPDVARAKMDWWGGALHEELPHPAVQALIKSGAASRLDHERFRSLIDGVMLTLDSRRFERREQAWEYFLTVGGPAAALEAELAGGGEPTINRLAVLGAVSCLVRQVRDLAVDARQNRWLVPLDIQAEFQVTRSDALAAEASAGFNGMVRQWLSDGFRRSESVIRELSPDEAWRHRHLLIQHELDRRLAIKMARKPQRILERRLLPGQIGNAWTAWRSARRLRRALGHNPKVL